MQPMTREAEFSATTPSLLLAFELGVGSSAPPESADIPRRFI